MAVSIRLTRGGAKKKPFYRIVVTDSRNRRDGQFLEIVGHFDPLRRPESIELKMDRIQEWIDKGGRPTPAVQKIIKEKAKLSQSL